MLPSNVVECLNVCWFFGTPRGHTLLLHRYSGHATTFEAAVHGFGSVQELKKIRKEVKAKFPPAQVRGLPSLPFLSSFYLQLPFLRPALCFDVLMF